MKSIFLPFAHTHIKNSVIGNYLLVIAFKMRYFVNVAGLHETSRSTQEEKLKNAQNVMRGRIIANIIACVIPSKRLRHKLRKWKGFETESDRLYRELNYVKTLLRHSLGSPSAIPTTGGLLRTIQLVLTDKMSQLDKTLKEAGISYWFDFGGLLGAVRHKGFIPWDNDLDISINYDDKEKLIEILNAKGIEFYTPEGKEGEVRIACMPQSEGYDRAPNYSVHIDIFSYKKLEHLSDEDVPIIEKFMQSMRRKHACFSKGYHKEVMSWLDSYSPIEPGGNLTVYIRGIDYVPALKNAVYVVKEEVLMPLSPYIFENAEFTGPAQHIRYLSDIYGDYMGWPPSFAQSKTENLLTANDRCLLLQRYGTKI